MLMPMSQGRDPGGAARGMDPWTGTTQQLSAPGPQPRLDAEHPGPVPPSTSRCAPAPELRRVLARGQVLAGAYEIGTLLGSGGMGQVYEAVDRRSGAVRALKVGHRGLPADVLETEARVLAGLDHPGIVRVHDAGTHDGTPFLVMERLYGRTLRAYLHQCPPPRPGRSRGPFALGRALDVLIRIADALAALHARGFVHCDLKPSNIILERRPAGMARCAPEPGALAPWEHPVLVDLGVSCPRAEAAHERRVAGSPHYIAPEVITSSITRQLAPCIDIYALGVIAFEMMTGRRPFESHGGIDPLRLQLYAIPPRASDVAVGVPAPLDRLIDEMLRKEAEARPASALVVLARLHALQQAAAPVESRRARR